MLLINHSDWFLVIQLDWGIVGRLARAIFLCVTPTFLKLTEALSSSALVHKIGVLRFKHFWLNYCHLFFKKKQRNTTFLKGFWSNFHINFVNKCAGTYFWCFVIQTFFTFCPFLKKKKIQRNTCTLLFSTPTTFLKRF